MFRDMEHSVRVTRKKLLYYYRENYLPLVVIVSCATFVVELALYFTVDHKQSVFYFVGIAPYIPILILQIYVQKWQIKMLFNIAPLLLIISTICKFELNNTQQSIYYMTYQFKSGCL
jgi:hypothetical protein